MVLATMSVLSEVLMVIAAIIFSLSFSDTFPATSLGSICSPAIQVRITVIIEVVRVPVLSEQIVVADPMVSQAEEVLTMFMSDIIFVTEKARAMVTASGRPSGTATTKIVMPMMKNLIHCMWCTVWSHSSLQHAFSLNRMPKRMKRMMMIPIPNTAPTLVMRMVMSSSLRCMMERPLDSSSSSSSLSPSSVFSYVFVPTPITIIRPSPSWTSVPLKTIGVLSGVGSYLAARSSGVAPGVFICCKSRSVGTGKWPFSLNS
mmetsp:Transcript_11064/g.26865  ORF Transcript_11064/g.26865 Transcript_11064/m.26865 type:complete len:259 (-) Transcript_11064:825-1601(-)